MDETLVPPRNARRRDVIRAGTAIALAALHPRTLASGALIVDILDTDPWGTREGDGTVSGVFATLARKLGEAAHIQVVPRLVPLRRAIREVTSSMADMTICLDYDELCQQAIALGPLGQLEIAVHTRTGQPIRSLADMGGALVGAMVNDVRLQELLSQPSLRVASFGTAAQLWRMLAAGRLDAIAGVHCTLAVAADRIGISPQHRHPAYVLGTRPVKAWMAPRFANTPLKISMQQAVTSLNGSRALEALLAELKRQT